jgi:hypothetical protein
VKRSLRKDEKKKSAVRLKRKALENLVEWRKN